MTVGQLIVTDFWCDIIIGCRRPENLIIGTLEVTAPLT